MKILANSIMKLILTLLFGFLVILFSGQIIAQPGPHVFIDVYRTEKITPEIIRNRFGDDLETVSKIFSGSYVLPAQSGQQELEKLGHKIKSGLKNMGEFAYIQGSFTKSAGSKDVYLALDVVDKKDSNRLANFLPKPTHTFPDPDNLITLWQGYSQIGYMKVINEKKPLSYKKCPAYYCLFGFEAPEFKKYQSIFATLVPKNKEKLIEILRAEHNPENRAAAAVLLAHIKDGNELIKTLLPAMRDSSPQVRSSVMAVLGYALIQLKTADFPVLNAIDALDYPDSDDRKQALWLLSAISQQPRYALYIKEHAKAQLIAQLKMQKPEIHNSAYQILKQISGNKFGSRDYKAWENWLNTTKSS